MRFSFTEELLVTERERWNVDAGSLEEACRKFERLRFEEDGEIVKSRRHDSFLASVSDEAGNEYPVDLALDLISKAEGGPCEEYGPGAHD